MKLWVGLLLVTLSIAGVQPPVQERINLELGDTKITENGEVVFEFSGKCGAGEVVAFHLPQKGWFVASVHPAAGYDFQKIGKLMGNKITFQMDNRRYEIASNQPISRQVSTLDLWIVQITPPAGKAHAESKLINCSSDFKYFLKNNVEKEETR